jgi:hypothetical protein
MGRMQQSWLKKIKSCLSLVLIGKYDSLLKKKHPLSHQAKKINK